MNKFYLILITCFFTILNAQDNKDQTITVINQTGLAITVVWGSLESDRTNQFDDGQTSREITIPEGYDKFAVTCHNINGCYSKLPDSGKDTVFLTAVPGQTYYVTCDNNNCTNKLLLSQGAPAAPTSPFNQEMQNFFMKNVPSTMNLPGSQLSSNTFGGSF